MAARRTLNVVISGDSSDLNKAFRSVDRAADKSEKRLKGFSRNAAKGFAVVGAAAGTAAAVGFKKSVDAAIEAEKAQAKMTAQLKASNISYKAHAKEIDTVIQKHSKLSGFDDENLQDSFTNIVRVTGDVSKSLKLTGLAADFARAKNIDVAKAGELVGKVAGGNTGILARYGIQVEKGATAQEALATLQKKFSGQAEAYGKTTAGASDRASVAMENLGEVVGAKLTPLLAKGATALVNLVDQAGTLAGPMRTVSGAIGRAYRAISNAVSDFAKKHRREIADVVEAAQRVGRVLRFLFMNVTLPVIRTAARLIGRTITTLAGVFGKFISAFAALVNGDWKTAVERFKDAARIAIKGVIDLFKGAGRLIWGAVTGLGKLITRGIVKGMGALGHAILDKVKDAAGWVADKAKGVFGAIGGAITGDVAAGFKDVAAARPIARGGGGSGFGLAPAGSAGLAKINSLFGGVRVTSGRRSPAQNAAVGGAPNSDHLTGNALDLVPAGGWTPQGTAHLDRIAAWAKRQPNVRWVGWRGVPGHGPGDHLHISFAGAVPRRGGQAVGDMPARIARRQASGIGVAAAAARAAGFRGSNLVTALAVAGPESGYNPRARLNTSAEDSRGLWQINTKAHPWSRSMNLYDPVVNARAAMRVYKQAGGWGPWTGYTSGRYRGFLDRARAAAIGSRGGGQGSRGTSGATKEFVAPFRGGGIGGAIASALGRNTPEQLAANADIAVAEAERSGNPMRQIAALTSQRKLVGARIRKIRRALKTSKNMRPAKRLELSQELAGLIGTHAGIGTAVGDLKSESGLGAMAGWNEAVAEAAPSPLDFLNRDISLAGLTGDTADDIAAATALRDFRAQQFAFSRGGDPRVEGEFAEALKSAEDALKALTDTTADQTAAMNQHTEALNGVKEELKRQSDIASAVQTTEAFQLKKYLADVLSGQIAGYGVARSFTPGGGREFAW